jgi:DNA polymerase-3 subunit gamma/tau
VTSSGTEPEIPVEEAVAELEAAPAVSTNAPTPVAEPVEAQPVEAPADAPSTSSGTAPVAEQPAAASVSLQQMKDTWPEILEAVQKASMNAWTVVFNAQLRALDGDVLTLVFTNQTDQATFKELTPAGEGVSATLRTAILDLLGIRVKFMAPLGTPPAAEPVAVRPSTSSGTARPSPSAAPATPPPADDEAPEPTEPDVEPGGWAVAAIPPSAPTEEELQAQRAAARKPAAKVVPVPTTDDARYGESVVREILNASFIEEQAVAPRVVPKDL